MGFTKFGIIIAVMGALMVLAAACGNDDPVATNESTVAEPTPTGEALIEAPKTTPEVDLVALELEVCATTRAAQLPIEFEYAGTVPTGFDGINTANCTFSKAVETVTLTLTGPATHTEVFTLSEASTQVSFPLPEDPLSISTLEIVPPGEYQREMTVTSVNGETLVISDQPGVLKTVTILEPQS